MPFLFKKNCKLFLITTYNVLESEMIEMLGHPKFIKFNKKYKTLLDHWRNGQCTMQQVLEAIEVLEKISFYKK